MRILSTRCMDNLNKQSDDASEEIYTSPSKQTLDLIKQFARVYRVEPVIRPEICGYVLN